jgi:serine/threonine-protein kinase RsbW
VDPRVVATVPALPEYVRVHRAVARAVAARANFTYDRIEDLHLAVDEACAAVLNLAGEAGTLTMRLQPEDPDIVVLVCSDAAVDADGWPPSDVEGSLPWRVLSALADEAVFKVDQGRPAVVMTFRGPAG